jgi:hypothetical protein
MPRSTGSAIPTASDSSQGDPERNRLAALLEAARRATWDAKHGPAHLRSGRFFISEAFDAHSSVPLSSQQSSKR